MRALIDEIWKDIEKFGWDTVKHKKNFYIQKSYTMELSHNEIEEIDFTYETVGYGQEYEDRAEFECGECHKKFLSREALYTHYTEDHEGNKPL